MIDAKTIYDLEYAKVIEECSGFTHTRAAKDRLNELLPADTFERAVDMMETTSEVMKALSDYSISPYFSCANIGELLQNVEKGGNLSISELYEIMQFVDVTVKNIDCFATLDRTEYLHLGAMYGKIHNFSTLGSALKKCIQNENELYDTASDKLYEIRQEMRKISQRINKKLKSYFTDGESNPMLQSETVSIRENRYVIPLKAEFKGRIKGIVHDQSSSGATLFIEPMEVFDLNNELREYALAENMEVHRILWSLTQKVMAVGDMLQSSYDAIIDLDCAFAKAYYASQKKNILPVLNNKGYIRIVNGKHPLIDPKKVVPSSLELGKDHRVILISGPNTGGKTVAMKMVGLLTLLAMSGMYVSASDGTELSFFSNVFTDIGDSQSIENDLSTFSSHVVNLAHITDNMTPDSLILLDEIGGGTEPGEGAALATAVTKRIGEVGAKAIMTTHYNALKVYCYNHDYCVNACVDYDKATMQPTYKLLIGSAGSSNALEIAERYGLHPDIIADAYAALSDVDLEFERAVRNAEEVNRQLSETKAHYESLVAETEAQLRTLNEKNRTLDEKLEDIRRRSKQMVDDMIRDYVAEADELIAEIKRLKRQADEQAVIRANHLKKELEQKAPVVDDMPETKFEYIDGAITKGDDVYLPGLKAMGTVRAVKGGKVEVSVGNLTTTVKLSEVRRIRLLVKRDTSKPKKQYEPDTFKPRAFSPELILLGQTVAEALDNLEAFLEEATKQGVSEVRIVHGKGTYTLRSAVQNYLRHSPYCKSFRSGRYGEGETGVTIVTLR